MRQIKAIGIIPARYDSSRFPGKVLAEMKTKPMIWHVWERARQAASLEKVIIACDDERILKASLDFGAEALMTSKHHNSGTDRITEIINPLDVDVVVNIQADEPLIHPSMINGLVEAFKDNPDICVSTLVKKITDEEDLFNPNIVKVVVDKNNFALYFSRAAIPHLAANSEVKIVDYYKHIGLYAYTKDFLFTFKKLTVSKLETIEKLEQLRIIENGYKIKVVETKFDTVSVDRLEDLKRAEEHLK
ncbi:MAG: 3-deoxy-manno-octulosonate cytidylyltransferase [Candidatus Omnitrophota bacterium]